MASRWATQCYQVLRRPWEIIGRDVEIVSKFRNNETMQCVRRLQVAWKIQEWKNINWLRFKRWSVLRCVNDYQEQSESYYLHQS